MKRKVLRDRFASIFFAATLYFATVFFAGMILGTVRQLWLLPKVGMTTALAIEVPIMIAISAFSILHVFKLRRQPFLTIELFWVGAIGLAMLLFAEELLSQFAWGISVFALWSGYSAADSALNYSAMVAFLFMPLIAGLYRKR